jgi:hypothetical protein
LPQKLCIIVILKKLDCKSNKSKAWTNYPNTLVLTRNTKGGCFQHTQMKVKILFHILKIRIIQNYG